MALKIEAEKMAAFKSRVDRLLIELDGSEAAPGTMGDDRLRRAQLGAPELGEAQFLYESYEIVHDELTKLSKVLGTQIEGMGLAVQTSRSDYADVDDDIQARMKAINAEVESYYDKNRDPFVEDVPAKKEADKKTGF
ncbi:hypothetical protein AB0K36_28900 [Streptomyces kurssanovii]|uniref:Uncharacterized protein n=1 Tax=Streptomyces kurssanovii TaxID=67312 RepID=A0ABV3I1R2_9ACTN